MNIVTKVAMHPGTETETVRKILKDLGVHVEVIRSPRQLKTLEFNGLMLLGGTDIAPFYYGEEIQFAHTPDDNRDYIEWSLIRRAMTQGLPIMGICRGHQMITIAHGGSLYQDIYRQRATTSHPPTHRVTLSTMLAKHAATDLVNSYHHQAARAVPPGFKVAARSSDGLIEGIYKPGVLGVQWHPEILYKADRRWCRLFEWFVNGLQYKRPGSIPGLLFACFHRNGLMDHQAPWPPSTACVTGGWESQPTKRNPVPRLKQAQNAEPTSRPVLA